MQSLTSTQPNLNKLKYFKPTRRNMEDILKNGRQPQIFQNGR